MLLFFFLFCFIFLQGFLNAQEWAPIGAKWHMSEGYGWAPYLGYHGMESIKDTIIGGKSARMCREFDYHHQTDSLFYFTKHYFFDSADKVYFYNKPLGQWNLLYDFSKQVGDTIFYPWNDILIPDTIRFYNIVDSVYTLNINGINRKAQDVIQGMDSSINVIWLDWFGGTNIQGIGRNYSMFPTPHNSDRYEFELRCYEDTIIGLYTNPQFIQWHQGVSCDSVIFLNISEERINNVRIYPNPSRSNLRITGMQNDSQIKILNLNGEVVFSKKADTNTSIDIQSLVEGIYIIEIINSDQAIRKKFIKSN